MIEVDPIEFSDEAAVTTPIRTAKRRDPDE